jgi:hypothetical protein
MRRFVERMDRGQSTLFPERLENWIGEDNAIRVIDVSIEELDLAVIDSMDSVEATAAAHPRLLSSEAGSEVIYGYISVE